jgi:CPA1 family monovalent cation:H+ antiporter
LTLVLLLLATVVLAPLAERLLVPYPAVLLGCGLVLALVPGLPVPEVDPEWILPVVLPPLLFAAARRTSWRQFLDNRRAIGLLAVALVAVTAFAVGFVVSALVPGLPLAAAVALGAAVAPPDPVAATAVARKLGLPRRLRTILEGRDCPTTPPRWCSTTSPSRPRLPVPSRRRGPPLHLASPS